MRQSERDKQLSRCAARLFRGDQALLSIGVDVRLAGCAITQLARVDELAHHVGRYAGALLRVTAATPLRSTLTLLRPLLADGAKLVLMAASRPSAGERLSGFIAREPPRTVALEALCESLLCAGLSTPRVHADVPGFHVVSASLPERAHPLDVFFTQPSDPTRR